MGKVNQGHTLKEGFGLGTLPTPGEQVDLSVCQSNRKTMHAGHPAIYRATPHNEGLSC